MGKSLSGRELGKGLSQRKDGRYQARFTNRFGKRVEFKSNNFSDAKKWLEQEMAKDSLKINCIDRTVTLNEWFVKWLNVYKYDVIRESTRSTYIQHYNKTIAPFLGKMKLQDISTLHIKTLLNNMDKDGYSYGTKNMIRKILFDMFDKAMLDDFVTKNPVRPAKLKDDNDNIVRVLTRDEQEIFLECATGTFYGNLFIVMLNTGMRIGEVAGLKKKDIDFEAGTITVERTLSYQKYEGDGQKEFHFGPPKTDSSARKIPINNACKIALQKQLMQKQVIAARGIKAVPDEFCECIFTTKFNTPICTQNIIDAIKRICDEINLMLEPSEQIVPFSPHCFRHTFATRCLENDIQPKVLQHILGHATLAMTMDLYGHVLDDFKQDSMKLFEKKMNEYNTEQVTEKRFKNYQIESEKVIRIS